jgi:predicted outer membrane repeat protein
MAARTAAAAAAALLCGALGLGVIAVSSIPSGAATTATLYVDNVNGAATIGCTSSGSGACKTIQDGVNAAEALNGTAVTLDVAGSSTTYAESVTINLPSSSGDTLDIEGTGSTQPTLDNDGSGSDVSIPNTSAGAVTIDHMTISGGTSSTAGGGINSLGTGTLTVGADTFSSNKAGTADTDFGGAIAAADACEGGTSGSLVVSGSTFTGNSAGGDGGAVDANDYCTGGATPGSLTVTDSTFVSNTSSFGGAVSSWQTGSTVTNSTFASNSTATTDDGGAFGGVGVSFVDDTFTANADTAIYNDGSTSDVSIANSLLADAPGSPECSEAVTDGGYNVAADATCGFGSTSAQNSTTIGTLTLAANGSTGPQTAAITPTSSAYQFVPASACTVTTDERGQIRPGFGKTACDAGAYELQKNTGYDLSGSDGGVFVFPTGQGKGYYGSLPGLGVKVNNVVGIVPTLNYNGYDLAGSDGGVFVFPTGIGYGFYGSLPGLGVKVNNVVGMVPTLNNHGYDLVGSDGGVFVFPTGQTSGFFGSLPGLGVHVNNIVGLVVQPGGGGYLLAGRDGGVFAFGSAKYYGSLPGSGITANNIVGIASTVDGKGYYLVSSNGNVYPFGDAVSHGSLPTMGVSVSNIVSIVPTADGSGYWLIGSDGGVFAFNAGFIGSLPGLNVRVSNIVGAVPTAY